MAIFAYKAMGQGTLAVSGVITADTPRQARDLLRAQGLTVQRIASQKSTKPFGLGLGRVFRRRHTAEVVSFVRELATLLGVGIPMLEAIDTIAKQHRGPFQSVLLSLRDRVSSGSSLAEAMRQHPHIFDEFFVNITEVGQSSGTLETALERLAQFKERSLQLKNRIGTAMLYPCLVLMTGMIVSVFLMTFVVPNILATLVESGHELPLATRLVKGVSDLLLGWWWALIVGLIALASIAGALFRRPTVRRRLDRFVLSVPILADLVRKQATVRIALVISTLMRSGIGFVHAVQLAQKSTRNQVLRDALVSCEHAVHAGGEIAPALERTDAFPPLVVQVFSAGQQSGRLEDMLDRLVEDYDRQVITASQRLTTVLEPILILALAIVVGFIAFATFMPILEASSVL